MESKRRSEINKCYVKVKEHKACINRLKNSISVLYDNDEKSIENINKKIQNYNEKIKEIELKIKSIKNGEHDDEINKEYSLNAKSQNKQLLLNKQKRDQKNAKKLIQKKNIKNHNKLCWSDKNMQRIMDKEYKRFVRNSNSLPLKLKEKLKKMYNNTGYIYKNIHFYGLKKTKYENGCTKMFEKRGNILYTYKGYIDNFGNRQYKTFEKKLY
jgi:hypothetical protein